MSAPQSYADILREVDRLPKSDTDIPETTSDPVRPADLGGASLEEISTEVDPSAEPFYSLEAHPQDQGQDEYEEEEEEGGEEQEAAAGAAVEAPPAGRLPNSEKKVTFAPLAKWRVFSDGSLLENSPLIQDLVLFALITCGVLFLLPLLQSLVQRFLPFLGNGLSALVVAGALTSLFTVSLNRAVYVTCDL